MGDTKLDCGNGVIDVPVVEREKLLNEFKASISKDVRRSGVPWDFEGSIDGHRFKIYLVDSGGGLSVDNVWWIRVFCGRGGHQWVDLWFQGGEE